MTLFFCANIKKMKYEKKLVLFSLFAMNLVDEPAPEIKIEQGILSGITSPDGSFFEYLGIPYATSNSSTRFKAPLPPPSWTGVFKATRTYTCPQPTPLGWGSTEDCLKINVYVPAKPTIQKPLPVMLYIHGGAFFLGTGGKFMHAPNFLIRHDVIIATFTYRLGVLGFTCLGIPEAPGNAGLKDQLAALRWVKKNIAAFGGDPNNITLFGESAGATSAAILIASNVTDGLFHKAIMMSGSSIATWSINREPIYTASLFAKKLGYNTNDPKEIYDILSKLPYNEIVTYLERTLRNKYYETELVHLPCVEKYFPGEERIISELPYNAITRNPKNIPLMYGSTSHEGLYLISLLDEEKIKINDENYLFSSDLELPNEDEADRVSEEIRNHYFGKEKMSQKTIMNISEHLGDLYFVMPVLLETEIMLDKIDAPVYNYWFDYIGGRNYIKYHVTGYGDAPGASHGDTNLYLFYGSKWPFPVNKKDQKIIDMMTKMWTNFAKYGNPTPEPNEFAFKWTPSTKNNLNFLYIQDEFKMGPIPHMKSYKLWKSIYDKYRRTKIDLTQL